MTPRTASVGRFFVLAWLSTGAAAYAQERPSPAVEFAAGSLLFADDGIVTEGFVGAAARLHVLPRVSIGPEVAFINGNNHDHLMLTGNVTFDLLGPVQGQPRTLTPFVVLGGGLFRTRETFRPETFSSSDGAFTAGGGFRALLGHRAYAGVEARLGWETHIRLNGFLGIRFG